MRLDPLANRSGYNALGATVSLLLLSLNGLVCDVLGGANDLRDEMSPSEAFRILGLPWSATDNIPNIDKTVIQKQYHKQALKHHPDKNQHVSPNVATANFQRLVIAKEKCEEFLDEMTADQRISANMTPGQRAPDIMEVMNMLNIHELRRYINNLSPDLRENPMLAQYYAERVDKERRRINEAIMDLRISGAHSLDATYKSFPSDLQSNEIIRNCYREQLEYFYNMESNARKSVVSAKHWSKVTRTCRDLRQAGFRDEEVEEIRKLGEASFATKWRETLRSSRNLRELDTSYQAMHEHFINDHFELEELYKSLAINFVRLAMESATNMEQLDNIRLRNTRRAGIRDDKRINACYENRMTHFLIGVAVQCMREARDWITVQRIYREAPRDDDITVSYIARAKWFLVEDAMTNIMKEAEDWGTAEKMMEEVDENVRKQMERDAVRVSDALQHYFDRYRSIVEENFVDKVVRKLDSAVDASTVDSIYGELEQHENLYENSKIRKRYEDRKIELPVIERTENAPNWTEVEKIYAELEKTWPNYKEHPMIMASLEAVLSKFVQETLDDLNSAREDLSTLKTKYRKLHTQLREHAEIKATYEVNSAITRMKSAENWRQVQKIYVDVKGNLDDTCVAHTYQRCTLEKAYESRRNDFIKLAIEKVESAKDLTKLERVFRDVHDDFMCVPVKSRIARWYESGKGLFFNTNPVLTKERSLEGRGTCLRFHEVQRVYDSRRLYFEAIPVIKELDKDDSPFSQYLDRCLLCQQAPEIYDPNPNVMLFKACKRYYEQKNYEQVLNTYKEHFDDVFHDSTPPRIEQFDRILTDSMEQWLARDMVTSGDGWDVHETNCDRIVDIYERVPVLLVKQYDSVFSGVFAERVLKWYIPSDINADGEYDERHGGLNACSDDRFLEFLAKLYERVHPDAESVKRLLGTHHFDRVVQFVSKRIVNGMDAFTCDDYPRHDFFSRLPYGFRHDPLVKQRVVHELMGWVRSSNIACSFKDRHNNDCVLAKYTKLKKSQYLRWREMEDDTDDDDEHEELSDPALLDTVVKEILATWLQHPDSSDKESSCWIQQYKTLDTKLQKHPEIIDFVTEKATAWFNEEGSSIIEKYKNLASEEFCRDPDYRLVYFIVERIEAIGSAIDDEDFLRFLQMTSFIYNGTDDLHNDQRSAPVVEKLFDRLAAAAIKRIPNWDGSIDSDALNVHAFCKRLPAAFQNEQKVRRVVVEKTLDWISRSTASDDQFFTMYQKFPREDVSCPNIFDAESENQIGQAVWNRLFESGGSGQDSQQVDRGLECCIAEVYAYLAPLASFARTKDFFIEKVLKSQRVTDKIRFVFPVAFGFDETPIDYDVVQLIWKVAHTHEDISEVYEHLSAEQQQEWLSKEDTEFIIKKHPGIINDLYPSLWHSTGFRGTEYGAKMTIELCKSEASCTITELFATISEDIVAKLEADWRPFGSHTQWKKDATVMYNQLAPLAWSALPVGYPAADAITIYKLVPSSIRRRLAQQAWDALPLGSSADDVKTLLNLLPDSASDHRFATFVKSALQEKVNQGEVAAVYLFLSLHLRAQDNITEIAVNVNKNIVDHFTILAACEDSKSKQERIRDREDVFMETANFLKRMAAQVLTQQASESNQNLLTVGTLESVIKFYDRFYMKCMMATGEGVESAWVRWQFVGRDYGWKLTDPKRTLQHNKDVAKSTLMAATGRKRPEKSVKFADLYSRFPLDVQDDPDILELAFEVCDWNERVQLYEFVTERNLLPSRLEDQERILLPAFRVYSAAKQGEVQDDKGLDNRAEESKNTVEFYKALSPKIHVSAPIAQKAVEACTCYEECKAEIKDLHETALKSAWYHNPRGFFFQRTERSAKTKEDTTEQEDAFSAVSTRDGSEKCNVSNAEDSSHEHDTSTAQGCFTNLFSCCF